MRTRGRPIEERFWEKVAKSNSCWIWTGGKVGEYGTFRVNTNRVERAHRFSWELAHGCIASDKIVCHTCDNPPCVNPAHLFIGTYWDNAKDREAKNRRHAARGERNGNAKLTKSDVAEIRKRHEGGGETFKSLAKEFRVHDATISQIVRQLTWT